MFIFDKIAGSETSSCTKIERENGLSTISQKSLLIEHLDWLPLYLTSREREKPPLSSVQLKGLFTAIFLFFISCKFVER